LSYFYNFVFLQTKSELLQAIDEYATGRIDLECVPVGDADEVSALSLLLSKIQLK